MTKDEILKRHIKWHVKWAKNYLKSYFGVGKNLVPTKYKKPDGLKN